jgi:hypothetical protein
VNWPQTFETVLETSSSELERSSTVLETSPTELETSSTELETVSTLPLTTDIDLATGFGVTYRYETPTATPAPSNPAIRHAITSPRRVTGLPTRRVYMRRYDRTTGSHDAVVLVVLVALVVSNRSTALHR